MTQLISLEQATPTTSMRDLGEFTVKSDAIRFTDPCYNNDTWCKGSMPALNGQWQAKLGFFRDKCDEGEILEIIALKTMAIEILGQISQYSEYEKYIKIQKAIKVHEKEHGRSINTSWKSVAYPKDVRSLVEELVPKLISLNHHKSWWNDEDYAQNTLEKLVSYILIEKNSCVLDRAGANDGHMLTMKLFMMRVPDGTTSKDFNQAHFSMTNPICIEALQNSLAYTQKLFDDGKPRRVQFLHIKHQSVPAFTPFDQELWIDHDGFNVGVDSGQAGFFDEGWYQNEYGGDKEDGNRSAYFKLCNLSYDDEGQKGGTFEFGVNSCTAHGDGSAPLYYRTDADGKVIEAVYHYDIAYEEDEEELA